VTPYNAWALARLDAHDQAALVRSGAIERDAPVEAAITRIEVLDPALNSVTYRAFDHARAAVGSADPATTMAGVPYLLKASLSYPGFPQTSCSRARRDVVASAHYPFSDRFDAAGLVPVGMSAMPEFGLLCSGEALLTGPALNPWDKSVTAGGSSTGAAIAVAAGLVPLAHASDAAGSIRVPAGNCGVIGFKPGRGMNVRARAEHLVDDLLCSDALIGRSVRDVAWAARTARPAPLDAPAARRLKIAVDLAGLTGSATAEVASVIQRTAGLCEQLGHHIDIQSMPLDRSDLREAIETIWAYLGGELVDFYGALRPGVPLDTLLEPWTLGLAAFRSTLPPERLARAYAAIAKAGAALADFHREWDVVLSPVAHSRPLPLGALSPECPFGELLPALFDYVDYTPLQNMTGAPSMSLPVFTTDDGLPIGSMLSAAQGGDELLLALAAEIETAAPWADRWPAIVPTGQMH
jgi:amidase